MAKTLQELKEFWDSPAGVARAAIEKARVAALPARTPAQVAEWHSAVAADKAAVKAVRDAERGHALHGTLDGIGAASIDESERPTFKLIARDFGNGHREACVMAVHPRLQDTLDRAIRRDLGHRAARGEGDRESSIDAACRRAKQKVRLKCKAMGVNSLWTLTYRANVTDRELVLRHLEQFVRRTRAVLGEFVYLAVLEPQERGAWHVHMATHQLPSRIVSGGAKVKSWDVMRAIWRRITGELGGNFDESKARKRWGTKDERISAGKVARYIAGYVAKDMRESELNRRRYSSSKGIELPEVYRATWRTEVHLAELIELAYAAVGSRIAGSWFDAERQVFFIESDDSLAVGCGPS